MLCPYANSWPHTSACVTGLQLFTLVSAHSRHARHWSHHCTLRIDWTVPRGPTNCQYSLVRPRPTVSIYFLHISPTRPIPSCCLRGLFFHVLRPDQSSHLSSGESPATSWIFPVHHSYLALISPLARQSTCPSIALSILCKTALLIDLRVD